MTILDRVITRYEGIFYKGEKYQKVKTNDALAKEKKKDWPISDFVGLFGYEVW